MNSDDRIDVRRIEASPQNPPGDQPVRYRVLGRYGDVLNAARGHTPRLLAPVSDQRTLRT